MECSITGYELGSFYKNTRMLDLNVKQVHYANWSIQPKNKTNQYIL